jgi:hypothetical protein
MAMDDGVRRSRTQGVPATFGALLLSLLAVSVAGPAAHGEFPDMKLSLLPEDESVYAPPAVPKEEEGTNLGGVNLDLKITYLSDYIYRGVEHSHFPGRSAKPNLQFDGTVTFNTGRLPHPFVGIFTNVFNGDPVSRFQEVRPTGGLDWYIRPLDIAAGVNAYIYPEREDLANTSEVWVRLTFDDSILFKSERPIFSPYGYVAYDYDKNHGFYCEVGIKHDFIIEDTGITFTVLGDVAYIDGIKQFFIFPTVQHFGFHHYDIGLIGTYSLNQFLHFPHRYGDVTLNGYLYYTSGIDRGIQNTATKVWGGVGVQFKY